MLLLANMEHKLQKQGFDSDANKRSRTTYHVTYYPV